MAEEEVPNATAIIGYGVPGGVSDRWPPFGDSDGLEVPAVGDHADMRAVKAGTPVPPVTPPVAVDSSAPVHPDDEF